MNKCGYCGYEHGVIGDTVCPIPLATSEFYQRKHKPVRLTQEIVWERDNLNILKHVDPKERKRDLGLAIIQIRSYCARRGLTGLKYNKLPIQARLLKIYRKARERMSDFIGSDTEKYTRLVLEKYFIIQTDSSGDTPYP